MSAVRPGRGHAPAAATPDTVSAGYALLHKIQQLVHDKAMVIPIWQLAFINGHGARVAESGLGLIPGHAYSAPYEDVKLKAGK